MFRNTGLVLNNVRPREPLETHKRVNCFSAGSPPRCRSPQPLGSCSHRDRALCLSLSLFLSLSPSFTVNRGPPAAEPIKERYRGDLSSVLGGTKGRRAGGAWEIWQDGFNYRAARARNHETCPCSERRKRAARLVRDAKELRCLWSPEKEMRWGKALSVRLLLLCEIRGERKCAARSVVLLYRVNYPLSDAGSV